MGNSDDKPQTPTGGLKLAEVFQIVEVGFAGIVFHLMDIRRIEEIPSAEEIKKWLLPLCLQEDKGEKKKKKKKKKSKISGFLSGKKDDEIKFLPHVQRVLDHCDQKILYERVIQRVKLLRERRNKSQEAQTQRQKI